MTIIDEYYLKRSNKFTLEAQQEISINLSLTKVRHNPCTILSGKVLYRGDPIEHATVKVLTLDYMPIAHTITNNEGKFIFSSKIYPGKYVIVATAPGYQTSMNYPIIMQANKPISVTIFLTASQFAGSGSLYGTVHDDCGLSLSEVEIAITNNNKAENIEALTHSNNDGEYLSYGLKPGKYLISAKKEGYYLPKKIEFESIPNEVLNIDICLYKCLQQINGTISGKICHNGKAVPFAMAALYQIIGNKSILVALKETNDLGIYLFSDVKPGEYFIKAKQERTIEYNQKVSI